METIIAIIMIVLLCVLFVILGIYARMGGEQDILAEQFTADFQVTKNLMGSCTKKDAAKLIDAFYDRWVGLVPEWTICAHVMDLRHHLEYEHRNTKDIIYSKPISKN